MTGKNEIIMVLGTSGTQYLHTEAARIMHSPVLYTAVPERNYDRQYAVYQKLSELFMEIS